MIDEENYNQAMLRALIRNLVIERCGIVYTDSPLLGKFAVCAYCSTITEIKSNEQEPEHTNWCPIIKGRNYLLGKKRWWDGNGA